MVHALGGCDTTSAIFGLGKGTVYNKIASDKALHYHCLTLQSYKSTPEQVAISGNELFVALYGDKLGDKLSGLRYAAYCSMSLSRRFQPEVVSVAERCCNACHAGSLSSYGLEPVK